MKQIKLYDVVPIRNIEEGNLSFGQRVFGNRYVKKGTKLYDLKYKDYFGNTLFSVEYIAPYDSFYVPNINCREHIKWHNWDYSSVEPILCELWESKEKYENADISIGKNNIKGPLYKPSADNEQKTERQQIEIIKPEICYTYLMLDEATGLYKIGMSNNPTYREHTLQSEKPAITLLSTQAHFNREEARNQEKYLHKKYQYARKRGEWFNLSQKDVKDIEILFEKSKR